jgi:hypothetical protein
MLPNVQPFSVRCEFCGHVDMYKRRQVIVFSGPDPGPEFVTHHAFTHS